MNPARPGRSALAWLVPLLAAGACSALVACGSTSSSGYGSDYGNGNGGGVASYGGTPGSDAAVATSPGADSSTPTDDGGAAEASPEAGPAAREGGRDAIADAGSGMDTGSTLNTFTLIDTDVNTIPEGEPVVGYDPIPEGATIDLGTIGTGISIRANTTPAIVGSVLFVLDGVYAHTENGSPYTLCSDDGKGNITPCIIPVGAHTLVVTPYSGSALDGGAMPSTTLYFTVTNSSTDGGTDASSDGAPTSDGAVVITL